MQFCVDIDNVITSTDEVMREIIADVTNGRVRLTYEHVVTFDYHRCVDASGNCLSLEDWKVVHEQFSTPANILRLRPMPGALPGLHDLAQLGQISLVTSRLPSARKPTIEWLEGHGLPPHNLHFVRHREKHASLRNFSAAIEDDYDQAVSFAHQGETTCYLISHPWNRSGKPIPGVQWCDSWERLVNQIRRDMSE